MRLRKLLSLMLLSLLLVTSFLGNNSVYASGEDQEFVFEGFDIKDLDKHPDVRDKIIENGFGDYIENGSKSYKEMSTLYDLSDLESDEPIEIEGVPAKEVERIIKQYNFPEREILVKEQNQVILVKRNVETNSIDGLIGVTAKLNSTVSAK
ncbi:hypothetical protein T458_26115 [Brevibacillus panacihumi W25]|uniref:Uncharacterized protein n=1 Tax=Brevibacillus panacihumi W25 TaxID=1408254 RepID=V6M2T4_9BACL|nr:hypothetical protein [Brevibacillus panacihumi]EST52195.1 hypothetical protein T458_26115 [Brevibacillus panacihumi W25]